MRRFVFLDEVEAAKIRDQSISLYSPEQKNCVYKQGNIKVITYPQIIPFWYAMLAGLYFLHGFHDYEQPCFRSRLGQRIRQEITLRVEQHREMQDALSEIDHTMAREWIFQLIGIDIKKVYDPDCYVSYMEALFVEMGLKPFLWWDDGLSSAEEAYYKHVTQIVRRESTWKIATPRFDKIMEKDPKGWQRQTIQTMKEVKLMQLFSDWSQHQSQKLEEILNYFGYRYELCSVEEDALFIACMMARTWKNQHFIRFSDGCTIYFHDTECMYPLEAEMDLLQRIDSTLREWYEEVYTPLFPMDE